jgi:hypothetical protein
MSTGHKNKKAFNDEELEKTAPFLSHLKKETPFSVPAGYFDSMHAEVMKKIESAPEMESAKGENPFRVPAQYFDSLPTLVQQKIIAEKARRISITEWIGRAFTNPVPRYALALASVVLVIVFSAKYFTRTVHVEYAETNVTESEQFDEAFLSQLDESVLAEEYAEEAFSSTEAQAIENYLLDNDIDLLSITEQL